MPFYTSKLTGVSSEIFRLITRLSGLTGEIQFPQCDLTYKEQEILNPGERRLSDSKRRHSWYSCDTWRTNSEPQVPPETTKQTAARTMESLTNEMVSDILGEVTNRLTGEKNNHAQSESQLSDVDDNCEEDKNKMVAKVLQSKLLNCELISLRLAFLQFSALKALNSLLTASKYTELLLIPESLASEVNLNLKCDALSDKEALDSSEENVKDALKFLMKCVVNKSVESCKLKSVVNLAELERAENILHLMYSKSKSEEGLELEEIKSKIYKILHRQNHNHNTISSHQTQNNTNSANNQNLTITRNSFSNSSVQGPFRLSRGVALSPPTSLQIAQVPPQSPAVQPTQRTVFNGSLTPLRSVTIDLPSINSSSGTISGQSTNITSATDSRTMVTTRVGPLPPIAQPLLEIGFTAGQIVRALTVTGLSGDLNRHSVNFLALWMLENGTERDADALGNIASAPASANRMDTGTANQENNIQRMQVS